MDDAILKSFGIELRNVSLGKQKYYIQTGIFYGVLQVFGLV